MGNNSNKEDCESIPIWVQTINENPDMLHLDYTPAVHKLAGGGLKAALAILPLLHGEDIWERLRAQRVLEGVIQRTYDWKPGQGYPPQSNGEQEFKTLWQQMGNYNGDASAEVRTASEKKWKEWLQNQIEKDE